MDGPVHAAVLHRRQHSYFLKREQNNRFQTALPSPLSFPWIAFDRCLKKQWRDAGAFH
jgi:hypothetical protein